MIELYDGQITDLLRNNPLQYDPEVMAMGYAIREEKRRIIRGSGMGVVFQEPGASLNPIRKIGRQFYDALHAHDRSITRAATQKRASAILKSMQFDDPERILDCCPLQLSGGMNQRVAIALAMVLNPALLLADEPTGALDTKAGNQIMDIFRRLSDEGMTILMITHELAIAQCADKIYHILDGQLRTYDEQQEGGAGNEEAE